MRNLRIVSVLVAFGMVATGGMSALGVALPFADDFEDTTLAGAGWSASSAEITTSQARQGNKSVQISSAGEMSINLGSAGDTNVWVHIYVKPATFVGNPSGDVDGRAAFSFKSNGDLLVFTNGNWGTLDTGYPVDEWIGMAVHLNYSRTNWDIYAATNSAYGEPLVKINSNPLAMGTNATTARLTSLEISSEMVAYVDAVGAGEVYRAPDDKLLAKLRPAVTKSTEAPPPYTYVGGDQEVVTGEIGVDLEQNLDNNDRVGIYSNGTWFAYATDGSGTWTLKSGVAGLNVTRAMGVEVARTNASASDVMAFYPYNSEPAQEQIEIAGNDTASAGWNQIAAPFDESRSANATDESGWEFEGDAAVGDEVWVFEDGKVLKRFVWMGATGWKLGSDEDPDYELQPGQGFWYWRRNSASEFDWPAD